MLRAVHAHRSSCANRWFSVHLSISQILLYIGWYQYKHASYLLCFPDLPTKQNVKLTPDVLRINSSSCVNLALTVRPPFTLHSVCALRSLTDYKRSSYSVHSALTVCSESTNCLLSVCLPFANRSAGKVWRFRDCRCKQIVACNIF